MPLTCIVDEQLLWHFKVYNAKGFRISFSQIKRQHFRILHFKMRQCEMRKGRKWQCLKCEKYFAICFIF